jgi:hypothetical protein
MLKRLSLILVKLGWVLWESMYFYAAVLRAMVLDRMIFSGLLLLLVSPYILTINAVMRFIPREHEEKVLPFVYTMQ